MSLPGYRYHHRLAAQASLPWQARGASLNQQQRAVVHAAFRSHSALSGLDEAVLDRFCESGRLSSYSPGELIFAEDAPCQDIQVILSGAVEMSWAGPAGEHGVETFMLPGEVINIVSVVDGARSMHHQRAHGHTRLFHIPMIVLYEQFALDHTLLFKVLELICARSRALHRRLGKMVMMSFRQRLVDQLLNLAERCGVADGDGISLGMAISQESLAALLMVSRQSVNRELGWLAEQGMVQLRYRSLKILDVAALQALQAAA
ncbi:Crp/Fnr family transcriptional regulator [Frateuria aurantia]